MPQDLERQCLPSPKIDLCELYPLCSPQVLFLSHSWVVLALLLTMDPPVTKPEPGIRPRFSPLPTWESVLHDTLMALPAPIPPVLPQLAFGINYPVAVTSQYPEPPISYVLFLQIASPVNFQSSNLLLKPLASGKLLCSTGSSAPCSMMTWRGEMGRVGARLKREGRYIYI